MQDREPAACTASRALETCDSSASAPWRGALRAEPDTRSAAHAFAHASPCPGGEAAGRRGAQSLRAASVLHGCALLGLVLASGAAPAADLGIDYSLEYRRAVDGGTARGGAWLDELIVHASEGETWFASVLATHGNAFSEPFVGDLQGVSNIEAGRNLRLYEAWYQWGVGEALLLAGLFDLNREFDAIEAASLFQHPSHGIGPDYSQSGERGPSIFPHAAFALRLAGETAGTGWRVALIDAVPGSPRSERHTAVQLSADEGALLAAEVGRGEAVRWGLGAWVYSEQQPRLDARGRDRQSGMYAFAERILMQHDGALLRGFIRLGSAFGDALPLRHYAGTGAVLEQGAHSVGLAVAHARPTRLARALLAAAEARPASHETAIELTWRWQLTTSLALQPDLQWIGNPGGRRDVDGAWVAALRGEWSW